MNNDNKAQKLTTAQGGQGRGAVIYHIRYNISYKIEKDNLLPIITVSSSVERWIMYINLMICY